MGVKFQHLPTGRTIELDDEAEVERHRLFNQYAELVDEPAEPIDLDDAARKVAEAGELIEGLKKLAENGVDETRLQELGARGLDALPTVRELVAELDSPKPFDPADHTIPDVLAYLAAADDAEKARVLEAEAAGKSRAGILTP